MPLTFPKNPPIRSRRRDKAARGFALLVTITLVAFLVLVLLSLATLTRVETRVAGNAQTIAAARQNALVGLQIALGELQKYAGPDQRVTAPATTVFPGKDVTTGTGELYDGGSDLGAGNGYRDFARTSSQRSYLNRVETYLTPAERTGWDAAVTAYWNNDAAAADADAPRRNPHWLGVFDSSLRVDRATDPGAAPVSLSRQSYEDDPDTLYGEPDRAQLPAWIVSGNERFSIAPAATASYPNGYYTPDRPLADQLASDPDLPADANVADYTVTLVGEHSATLPVDSTDGLDGRVVARKMPLTGERPGLAGEQTVGHYAYWVGDESQKANFAVHDPYYAAAQGTVDYRNRLQVPQRIGWENMTGFVGSGVDVNDPRFLQILSVGQIGFLDTSFQGTASDPGPVERNFHSLTGRSRSLLTDTMLGGLRQDLTPFLANGTGLSSSAPIADPNRYDPDDARFRAWGGSNQGFPHSTTAALDGIPTWGQLRQWYLNEAGSGGGSISPNASTGVGPVLTYVMFQGGWSYDGGTQTVRWHWMPCLVLWNPYDVGLSAADYRIELEFSPEVWNGYIVNPSPTLAELQAQAGAEWAADPNPSVDENGDGVPDNDWRFTNTSGDTRIRLNPTDPDTVNVINADIVGDSDLTDGVTDAFGRLYYALESADPANIYVGVQSPGAGSMLGNRAVGYRLVPHHNLNTVYQQRPLKRPMLLSTGATSFAAGEAKVFTLASDDQWSIGNALQLANDYLPDEPTYAWFDFLRVVNGPASAEAADLRWNFTALATGIGSPKVVISVGGQTLSTTEAFGSVEASKAWLMAQGRNYVGMNSGTKDSDGDGLPNSGEITPKFVSSWRSLYDFTNFADHITTSSGSTTNASNWSFGRSWAQPITGPGNVAVASVYSYQAVLSRFNFGAQYMDLHPLVDALRDIYDVNNYDSAGNREGLPRLSVNLSRDSDGQGTAAEVKWDENQANGSEGYAFVTFKDTDGVYQGLNDISVRIARRADSSVLSLGQFQQANLSPYYWEPAFLIGNSWAPPYVDREAIAGLNSRQIGTMRDPTAAVTSTTILYPTAGYRGNNADEGTVSYTSAAGRAIKVPTPGNTLLDLGYLLNENLWDRYFLSGVSGTADPSSTDPLPNARLRYTAAALGAASGMLANPKTRAAFMENVGALNVNSTSVEAWKALLSAFRDLSLGDNPADTVPVARTLDPLEDSIRFAFDATLSPDISSSDISATLGEKNYTKGLTGFRYLTDGMIQTLAERIVDEVRLRGPFYSVADFVNRRLVAPSGSHTPGSAWYEARTNGRVNDAAKPTDNHPDFMDPGYDPFIGLAGLSGTLQRAIQVSGINGGVNDPRFGQDGTGPGDRADMVYTVRIRNGGDANYLGNNNTEYTASGVGGASNNLSGSSGAVVYRHTQEPTMRSHLDTEHLVGAPAGEAGQLFDGTPGFVTQGDLLSMIGPALVARGDTFVVRTYGDSVNSVTGETEARVWLEAVVQRVADPVTRASENTSDADYWRPADRFGRRFVVTTFRWLGPDDL